RFGFSKAGDGAVAIAEVGDVRTTLDRADFQVRASKLELQVGVAGSVGGELLEILQSFGDDGLPDRRRARQRRHGVVNREDDRVGQRPNVVEAAGGAADVKAIRWRRASLPIT